MTLSVKHVDTAYVSQIWPKVEGYIKDALDKGAPVETRNYDEKHIQVYLTSGQWLLLVAVDEQNEIHGACTVSFINYPLHRVAFITTIGGRLISNQETFAQLKEILNLENWFDNLIEREEAKRTAEVNAGGRAQKEMDNAPSFAAQVAVQNVIVSAMGFNPSFDVYRTLMLQDAVGYKQFEIYKNQQNVDNVRMMRRLNGASDKLHSDMVDSQYQLER